MSLAIVLVSLFSALNIVAMAAPGEMEVTFKWNVKDGKGHYNPADKGKEVTIYYFLEFKGKDKDGNQQNWLYAQRTFKGKIGDPVVITKEPTNSITDMNGNTYTDCEIFGVYFPLYPKNSEKKIQGNHIYGVSQGVNGNELWAIFDQNMETTTMAKVAPGSKIADEDKNNLPIKFTVAKIDTKTGKETYPVISNSGMEIHRIMNFKAGEMQVWNDENEGYSFRRAIDVNTFGMFSPYTGKYNKFILKAEFTGPRKAELEKRYSLDMTGDDLKGWTLTLSSKETNNNNPAKAYPKTGDTFNTTLYGMILFISLAGVAIITLKRSKKQN